MKKNRKAISLKKLITIQLAIYVVIVICSIFTWDHLWEYFYSEHRYNVEMTDAFEVDLNEYETVSEEYLINNGAGLEVLDENLNVVESKGVGTKTDYQYSPVELTELLLNENPKIMVSSLRVTNSDNVTYTIVLHQNVILETWSKLQRMAYIYAVVFIIGSIIILSISLFWFVGSIYNPIHRNLTYIKKNIVKTPHDKSKADVSKVSISEVKAVMEAYNSMIDEMETMRKDTDAVIDQSNRLISNLSHDLKSPITTLKGYSEVLMNEELSREDQLKYLGYINTNVSALSSMIGLLFEQVKFQCDDYSLDLQNKDMNNFLRNIVANYYILFDQRGFTMDIDIMENPYFMDLDVINFRRVFANLLDNCLSHNPSPTHISISTAIEWGCYVIYIKDNGVGIPRKDRDTIFEPFNQVDTSRTNQHSGLGLYVARQIVEKHGGTIRLTQDEFYKTSFKISFKLQQNDII